MSNLEAFLRGKLTDARALGHEWVQVTRATRGGNSPRHWDNCFVVTSSPRLKARCIGPGSIVGTWRFDVRVEDLAAWVREMDRRRA